MNPLRPSEHQPKVDDHRRRRKTDTSNTRDLLFNMDTLGTVIHSTTCKCTYSQKATYDTYRRNGKTQLHAPAGIA